MRVLIHDGGRHLRTYGFGRVARTLVDSVRENGHVALFSCPFPGNDALGTSAYEEELYHKTQNDADICIQIGQPKSSIRRGTIPLYFYTMFDTYSMPRDWIDHFSQADRIIVPTEQNAISLRDNGIAVDVLPLFDNTSLFKDRPDWRDEGRAEFSFIFVGTFSFRKSTPQLLQAFLEEFDHDEARLILICTESNPDNTFNFICDLQARSNKVMNIEVVTQGLSDEWLNRFYNRADCFISASKGEGWGYPIMEAALTGLPCILPDHLVSTEFLPRESNFYVPSHLLKVEEIPVNEASKNFRSSYIESNSSVIQTDTSELRQAMRNAYKIGRPQCRTMGLQNRDHLHRNLNRIQFNQRLDAILTGNGKSQPL